ncbi:hypothetical protein FHG87_015546 [Trinorchestia longiramus]|nr:hypothetical protein FHG87_015546 [Trinorchestia longiramus]
MGCNRLGDWWNTQPPLAVFLLTLVACAVTLVSISVYVGVHQDNFPNPNVRDWNSFFGSFSRVELCIPSITSNDTEVDLRQPDVLKGENVSSVTALVSISMEEVRPVKGMETVRDLLQHYVIVANVTEDLLGIKVPLSRQAELLQMVMGLPAKSKSGGKAAGYQFEACVTFKGPHFLLPNSDVVPRTCSRLKLPMVVVEALGASGKPCVATDAVMPVLLQQQQRLTPLLTRDDTMLIQLHIVYTTCALTVLILLLLGYAICRRVTLHALPTSPCIRLPGHYPGSSSEKVSGFLLLLHQAE